MSDSISRMVRQSEERRRKGAAYARRVSATLRRAGVPKAGRYITFGGYDPDGFIASHNFGRVAVLFTSRKVGLEWQTQAIEILGGAGFEIGAERRLDREYDHGGFDMVTGLEGPLDTADDRRDRARDLAVHNASGELVAMLIQPRPRAPWWLHTLCGWTGDVPDSRRNGADAYYFRNRKTALAWLTEAGYTTTEAER